MAGLTTLREEKSELVTGSHITPCDTIVDQRGKVVTGTLAYISEVQKVGSKVKLTARTMV